MINSDTKPANPTKVVSTKAGYEGTELDPSLVSLEMVSGTNAANKPVKLFNELGKYTFTATADPTDESIDKTAAATQTVYVNKVAGELTYTYKGAALQDSYTMNLAEWENFDWEAIEVFAGDAKQVRNTGYFLNVVNLATGANGAGEDMKGDAGTYAITITSNPSELGYKYGGSKTVIVKVVKDVLDADANVFVTLDDKLVTSIEKEYDGKAITFVPGNTGNLKVTVEDADGNKLSYGSANGYSVTIYNEYNENVTGSPIVNAGTYTLVVKSSTYELTGTTEMTITINKADLTNLKVGALKTWSGAEYLPVAGTVNSGKGYTWADLDIQFVRDGEWTNLLDAFSYIKANDDDLLTLERYDAATGEWGRPVLGRARQGGRSVPPDHQGRRLRLLREELRLRRRGHQLHLGRVPGRRPRAARVHRRQAGRRVLQLHRLDVRRRLRQGLRQHQRLRPVRLHHPRRRRDHPLPHGQGHPVL